MLKKSIIWLFIVSILFGCIGCSKKDDGPKKDNKTVQENKNEEGLTPESKNIIIWWLNPEPDDVLVNAFIRENPEYTIDNTETVVGPFGDLTVDLPKLASAVAANEQPDVFLGYMTPIEGYYTNLFMPIEGMLNKDDEFKIEDIDNQVFETVTFNNKIYFVPYDYTSQVFTWNKDLFESVGLNPDNPPKTWDQYLEYTQKLTIYNPDGSLKTIGAFQDHFRWDIWYITATGEHFVDKTGLNINWNTPVMVDLMELSRSIADAHKGRELVEGGMWWIVFGNVAMAEASANGLRWLAENSNFEMGISRIPMLREGDEYYSAGVVDSFLGIPKTASNPKGGWMFMKYVTTDGRIEEELHNYEANAESYMSNYIIHKPTREKLYKTFESLISEELMENMKLRDRLVEEANRSYYKAAFHTEMINHFNEQYKKMLDHELAPQDMLINMQKFSDSLKEEFIKRRESEGWTFDESGNGIPPS